MPLITLITKFLGSTFGKYAMIGLAFVAMIAYFKASIWTLELNISSLETDVKELVVDLKVSKHNTSSCLMTNKKNDKVLEAYKADVITLKENQEIITSGRLKEIDMLKNTLKDLRKPIVYPEEIIMKECKIKIKTMEDINETDSTFTSFSSVGW